MSVAKAGSTLTLILVSVFASVLAFTAKQACRDGAWNVGVAQYQAHCYTDIYPLYFGEGLSSGQTPYLHHNVEYPVLVGAAMEAVAKIVQPVADPSARGKDFFDLTSIAMLVFFVAAVLATGYLAGRSRRWTALMLALSPAVILAALINWDMFAMCLAVLSMAAWAARRQVLAGVLLGLAVATKFYPIVLLFPLLLLCLRAGRMRAFLISAGSALAAWAAVNLPVAIAAPGGWSWFYRFSSHRWADWGSIWYFFATYHWPVVGNLQTGGLNRWSLGLFALACGLIGWLALAAPRRPRLPQLAFLTVAAFLLVNKVWSPQYVVWLAPLVVLARPRLWSYSLWQAAEVGYFYAIWGYLIYLIAGSHTSGAVTPGWYFAAVLGRFCAVLLLCALVVTDILRPDRDVVRADGEDDPAGGVLAGAPDRYRLRLRPRPVTVPDAPTASPADYPAQAPDR
jgi:uncharacterized membrane protein